MEADVDARLGLAQEGVEPAHDERPEVGAPEAGRSSDDEHREGQEREVEVHLAARDRAEHVHVQRAREPRERTRERERPQPLTMDVDADACRRGGILARCAQHAAEAALLVCERDRDHDQHSDDGLHASGGLRHERERRRSRSDRRPVVQEVERDLQHREGGDARRQTGQPHQRKAEHEREHAPERGAEDQRRHVPDRVVSQDREQVGHDARLRFERDRHDPRDERADGDEAHVPEREDARVPDEDVDRHDHRDGDQRVQEVDVGGGRHEQLTMPTRHDEHRPEELHGVLACSYAVHRRRSSEQARGPTSSTTITSANTSDGQ